MKTNDNCVTITFRVNPGVKQKYDALNIMDKKNIKRIVEEFIAGRAKDGGSPIYKKYNLGKTNVISFKVAPSIKSIFKDFLLDDKRRVSMEVAKYILNA